MGRAGQLTRRPSNDADTPGPKTRSAMKLIRGRQGDNTIHVTAFSGHGAPHVLLINGLPAHNSDASNNAELGVSSSSVSVSSSSSSSSNSSRDQDPLLGSPRHHSNSSDSKQALVTVRHEAGYREIGMGLCPVGVRYHTETWPKSSILLFLDNVLSWSTMFGYTACIYIIPFLFWLSWYTQFWPLYFIPAAFALSVFLPPEPLLWDGFQHTTLVSSWRRYFDFSIACSNNLDASARYIFAEYPHGVFPVSQLLSRSLVLKIWPQLRIYSIAATVVFRVPVWKHIMSWTGARPATASIFKQLLQKGSVALVPGGIAEMFITHPHKEVIKVRDRKGFVRIAVETGTPIVPVYHFGNSLLFRWVAPRAMEGWARRLRMAAGYTCGRWLTPLPNNAPLFMAIGDPIPVPQVSPSDPQFAAVVDVIHRQFEDALVKLYYKYRGQYGWNDRELVVL